MTEILELPKAKETYKTLRLDLSPSSGGTRKRGTYSSQHVRKS